MTDPRDLPPSKRASPTDRDRHSVATRHSPSGFDAAVNAMWVGAAAVTAPLTTAWNSIADRLKMIPDGRALKNAGDIADGFRTNLSNWQVTKFFADGLGHTVEKFVPGHHWESRSEAYRSGDPIGYLAASASRPFRDAWAQATDELTHVSVDWSRARIQAFAKKSWDQTFNGARIKAVAKDSWDRIQAVAKDSWDQTFHPEGINGAQLGDQMGNMERAYITMSLRPDPSRGFGKLGDVLSGASRGMSEVKLAAQTSQGVVQVTVSTAKAVGLQQVATATGKAIGGLIVHMSDDTPTRGPNAELFDRAEKIAGESDTGRKVSPGGMSPSRNDRIMTVTGGSDRGLERLENMDEVLKLDYRVSEGVTSRRYLVGDIAKSMKARFNNLVAESKDAYTKMWQRVSELSKARGMTVKNPLDNTKDAKVFESLPRRGSEEFGQLESSDKTLREYSNSYDTKYEQLSKFDDDLAAKIAVAFKKAP